MPQNPIERQIERIKQELRNLGPMRPGSITRQYRQPRERKRPFYQISYTHRMRGHSEYVRPEHLATLKKETATFKHFKRLVGQWIDLSLKTSRLRIRQTPLKTPRQT